MKGSQNFPDIQVLYSNRMSAMNMHLFAALRADAVRILYCPGFPHNGGQYGRTW